VSAWADGGSRAYAGRLQELFPHARLAAEGTAGDEGAVTFRGKARATAFRRSRRVLDSSTRWPRAPLRRAARRRDYRRGHDHAWRALRYDLGDRLSCRGYTGALPRLDLGTRGFADIVGEKLSEAS